MNRGEYGRELFANIEIPEDVKNNIYMNTKKGKRTADFRFKHACALTVALCALVVGSTGVFAKTCYDAITQHMEDMSEAEVADYSYEVENDTGVTIDDAWSRKLTNEEVLRISKLEREYYDEGIFPEQTVPRVSTLDEWDGQTVCYVDEDHLLHLPEPEMTDDQLRLFIDYSAKKEYVIEKEAEEIFAEEAAENPSEEEEVSPYVDVAVETEEDVIALAAPQLEKLFGEVPGEGWNTRVVAFEPSVPDPELGTMHDMYSVYWEQGAGSPNSTSYVVTLGMHDLRFIAAAVQGREYWATLKSFSEEEAKTRAEADWPKVYELLSDLYGVEGKPDREKLEIYHVYDEEGDAREARYVMYYKDKEVEVIWNLGEQKASLVQIYVE